MLNLVIGHLMIQKLEKSAQLNYLYLYGTKQVIAEPAHILENFTSCIDFVFTNQTNITIDSGVHSSLHEKCQH